jgi:hypothetical protein
MKDSARLLQERLEQLEAGRPLAACLADLPEDEADLLRLAARLGEVQYPERDSDTVAVQRADLLTLASRENKMKTKSFQQSEKIPVRLRPGRLLPLAAVAAVAALLLVCVLVAVVGGRFVWRSYQDARVAQNSSSAPTSTVMAQNPSPSSDVTPEASSILPPPTEASAALTYNIFFPVVVKPQAPNPQTVALRNVRGLVQIRAGDGDWAAVDAGRLAVAGQRIRTGPLSSVNLAFYDGSQAHLGPNTEVSIDELDARMSGGPRLVALTQWIGETEHDVAPAVSAGSRYEVRTPSATAQAKGTLFHVLVTASHFTRFGVDEGVVAVTSLNVTVVVVSGQTTTVEPEQPPDEPVFRITGEGEVTQTGLTWIIAGQTFETDDYTVIVGNPQVGDRVSVEGRLLPDGTRLADRIVLLRRAPENRFTLTGRVEVITGTTWTVAGQVIVVDDETDVEAGIENGDWVSVEGVILPGGTLLAERISLVEEGLGLPFDFVGVVQDVITDTWTVSGVTIVVDDETEIAEGLVVGDVVRVRGWILDDETWLARSIEQVEEEKREFEFTGYVESISPWIVSGIAFETNEWTAIEAGIGPGDRVRVEGHILEDGAWLAAEIERLDDEEEALYVVFVGTVTGTEPWLVSGISLVVNDETVIKGEVGVGDLVRVKARILADGTWLAREIARFGDEWAPGCFSVSAIVVGVNAGQIVLDNWPAINLDEGIALEGEVKVSSVILILVCADADGTTHIVSIIVIYRPEPVIIPPSPVPSPLPPPDDDSGKVTICHKPNSKNPHTITISRSALQTHLSHGDTLGPCPDRDDDDDDDHD